MRPMARNVAHSVVYVCVLGTRVRLSCAKNRPNSLNWSRCCLGWTGSCGPKEPYVTWRSRSSPWKGEVLSGNVCLCITWKTAQCYYCANVVANIALPDWKAAGISQKTRRLLLWTIPWSTHSNRSERSSWRIFSKTPCKLCELFYALHTQVVVSCWPQCTLPWQRMDSPGPTSAHASSLFLAIADLAHDSTTSATLALSTTLVQHLSMVHLCQQLWPLVKLYHSSSCWRG